MKFPRLWSSVTLKKGTGSEYPCAEPFEIARREVPVPLFQHGAARKRRARRGRWLLCLLLLVQFLVMLPGCGGCRQTRQPVKKKPEKPKIPFELPLAHTLPSDLETILAFSKPGHWTTASVQAVSNLANFRGEMATEAVALNDVPYRLITLRPALLPKEQLKRLDWTIFVPAGASTQSSSGKNTFPCRLVHRGSSRMLTETSLNIQGMPAYQFHFFVFAREPDDYTFLNALPTFHSTNEDARSRDNYRLLAPRIENYVPLSTNPLTWTSLAYVLWDDFDAELLTLAHQRAMLDWLHWGGQLVISGPSSLDSLRGTFLEPHLPATSEGTEPITAANLAEMDEAWTDSDEPWRVRREWLGEKLATVLDSTTLVGTPEGRPLVVERRVGRGRIVVTAFSLSQSELKGWSGCDAFFNDCLLRRPVGTVVDARRNSRLRIFSRDANPRSRDAMWRMFGDRPGMGAASPQYMFSNSNDMDDLGRETAGPGVCGWDDFNRVSQVARSSLQEAAKIVIPDATFVLRVLAIYLIVLVPLNWAVFRALGRVEWAWVAAPVISIVFALIVIRLAQLDIGFIRSRTEIGVVELYEGHSRAHVTRYTALYTSLATNYVVTFDDPSGLMQPLSVLSLDRGSQEANDSARRALAGSRTTVTLRNEGQVHFEGFRVASNSTGMLHSEHMMDLEGSIVLRSTRTGGWQVRNGTRLVLRDARVIGPLGVAVVGTLEPGDATVLAFSADADETARKIEQQRPNISGLLNIAATVDKGDEDFGTMRLIAWTDEVLGGMEIRPAAKQRRHANLVIAHLKAAPIAPPAALAQPSEDRTRGRLTGQARLSVSDD